MCYKRQSPNFSPLEFINLFPIEKFDLQIEDSWNSYDFYDVLNVKIR